MMWDRMRCVKGTPTAKEPSPIGPFGRPAPTADRGPTYETVEKLIHEVVVFHLEALRGDGNPIPEPSTSVGSVEVSVPR